MDSTSNPRASDPAEPPAHGNSLTGIDDAVAQSFPASDAPAWSPTHAGDPSHAPELLSRASDSRAQIRRDVEMLTAIVSTESTGPRPEREDFIARALLDAAGSVAREPVASGAAAKDSGDSADTGGMRNVEVERQGEDPGAPAVVLGARYDTPDVTRVALLLATLRALAPKKLRRTVRVVAFAGGDGPDGAPPVALTTYVERLRRDHAGVRAVVVLGTVAFGPERPGSATLLGSMSTGALLSEAAASFEGASRLALRSARRPLWWKGLRGTEAAALADLGWAAMLFQGGSEDDQASDPPVAWEVAAKAILDMADVDQIAASASGLLAILQKLGS